MAGLLTSACPIRSPQLTRWRRLVVEYDLADLARRLEAGEWLLGGEVAALLQVSRSTISRRMADGTIGVRKRAGTTWQVCNPVDVRRLWEESVTERRAGD
jgi:hypothetical protein